MFAFKQMLSDKTDPQSASLSVLEFCNLPWIPQRIYWLKNFKSGTTRGNHAHKSLSQIFMVLSGEVTIRLSRGLISETMVMTPVSGQLEIKPGTWRVISDATQDAILLVLASSPYTEEDYIRDWNEYMQWFTSEYVNEN